MKKRIILIFVCLMLCVAGCQSASNVPAEVPETSDFISMEQEPTSEPAASQEQNRISEPTAEQEQERGSEPTGSQAQESVDPQPSGTEGVGEIEDLPAETTAQPTETVPSTVHVHSYDGGTVTKAPSCTSAGVKTYICTICGAVKTEALEKTAHIWRDATCTAPKTCTVCGATEGSALGHSFTNGVCTRCGYYDPASEAALYQMSKDAFEIMNQFRADAGLPALTWNDQVFEAAQVRANEITEDFAHTRLDGSSCFTVLSEHNIVFYAAGENIAAGQRSAQEVMTSWYNSQGHRDNMLNSNFTQAAIACVYISGGYGYYWVTLFIG